MTLNPEALEAARKRNDGWASVEAVVARYLEVAYPEGVVSREGHEGLQAEYAKVWEQASEARTLLRQRTEQLREARGQLERLREAARALDSFSDTDNDGRPYLAHNADDYPGEFAAALEALRSLAESGGDPE